MRSQDLLRASPPWLGSGCNAFAPPAGLPLGLLECSQDMAAGCPESEQFRSEREPGGSHGLFGIQLGRSQSPFCHSPAIISKDQLPSAVHISRGADDSVSFQGRRTKEFVELFKTAVSGRVRGHSETQLSWGEVLPAPWRACVDAARSCVDQVPSTQALA